LISLITSFTFSPLINNVKAQTLITPVDTTQVSHWVFTEAEFDSLLVSLHKDAKQDSINLEIIALQDSIIKDFESLDNTNKFWSWPDATEAGLIILGILSAF
jgi:hypothetical protein